MKGLSKRKTKVLILSFGSILLASILAIAGIGVYFKLTKKDKSNADVNPLSFSIDTWDGSTVEATNFKQNYAGRGDLTKTINSASSFVHFINEVNNGKSFEGYRIYLNSNIDLKGNTIKSIGTENSPFKGTFDGGYYTILNANIKGTGLFGVTENATIENVGLYNATIESKQAVGLIGKAVNTDVSNTYVRLGTLKSNVGVGLIGEYISNNGEHYITNSFIDTNNTTALIHKLDTDNSSENQVSITYCYNTQTETVATEEVGTAFTYEEEVIKATNKSQFSTWSYSEKYSDKAAWCDYTNREGSLKLDFTYPIQSNFVKVYTNGSAYEGVLKAEGSEAQDVKSLSEAFKEADKVDEAEINLLVDKIFMDSSASVTNNTTITINALKDTTIVRSENNNESMFVGSGSSKIVIGSTSNIGTMSTEENKIVIDGNKDYVEANELESDALIKSYGGEVEIHSNVEIRNNVNTTSEYGGAVLLYNTKTQAVIEADIENCHAAKAGGGICAIGTMPAKVGSFKNCSAEKGGAIAFAKSMSQISSIGSSIGTSDTNDISVEVTAKSFVNNTATYGGAIYVASNVELDVVGATFTNNLATVNGGAIYADGKVNVNGDVTIIDSNNKNLGYAQIYANDQIVLNADVEMISTSQDVAAIGLNEENHIVLTKMPTHIVKVYKENITNVSEENPICIVKNRIGGDNIELMSTMSEQNIVDSFEVVNLPANAELTTNDDGDLVVEVSVTYTLTASPSSVTVEVGYSTSVTVTISSTVSISGYLSVGSSASNIATASSSNGDGNEISEGSTTIWIYGVAEGSATVTVYFVDMNHKETHTCSISVTVEDPEPKITPTISTGGYDGPVVVGETITLTCSASFNSSNVVGTWSASSTNYDIVDVDQDNANTFTVVAKNVGSASVIVTFYPDDTSTYVFLTSTELSYNVESSVMDPLFEYNPQQIIMNPGETQSIAWSADVDGTLSIAESSLVTATYDESYIYITAGISVGQDSVSFGFVPNSSDYASLYGMSINVTVRTPLARPYNIGYNYTGSTITFNYSSMIDTTTMAISGPTSGTDVGEYVVSISLLDPNTYCWDFQQGFADDPYGYHINNLTRRFNIYNTTISLHDASGSYKRYANVRYNSSAYYGGQIANGVITAAEAVYVPEAREGYVFDGWATSSGVKVLNANGTFVENVDGYVTNGYWQSINDVTLYEIWNEAPALDTPTGVMFNSIGSFGRVITGWNDVENASGYLLQLLKDGEAYGDVIELSASSNHPTQRYNFESLLRQGGVGTYKFTVVAIGSEGYSNSDAVTCSNATHVRNVTVTYTTGITSATVNSNVTYSAIDGETINLEAIAEDGYILDYWESECVGISSDDTTIADKKAASTTAKIGLTYANDVVITAFAKKNSVIIEFTSGNTDYGYVSTPSAITKYGTEITIDGSKLSFDDYEIEAKTFEYTPQYNYVFKHWEINGEEITGTYTVDGPVSIEAIFDVEVNYIQVNFVSNNTEYGTLNYDSEQILFGSKIIVEDNIMTIGEDENAIIVTATPTPESPELVYSFVGWDCPVNVVEDALTITANFAVETNKYTITISVNDGNYGKVENNEFIAEYGEEIRIDGNQLTIGEETAIAEVFEVLGYTNEFGTWTIDSVEIASGSTVQSDLSIVANFNFDIIIYTIEYLGLEDAEISGNPSEYTIETNDITLNNPSKVGYEFTGWTYEGNNVPTLSVTIPKGSTGNKVFTANWKAATDVLYTVNHYLEKIDNEEEQLTTLNSTLKESVPHYGTTGEVVSPEPNSYPGFTAPDKQTTEINADGTTVINYFYSRNQYVLTLVAKTGIEQVVGSGSYDYEKVVTIDAVVKAGYTWNNWSLESGTLPEGFDQTLKTQDITIGLDNLTLNANSNIETYTITYNLNGGTLSVENPPEYTVESETFTLINPEYAGFTFAGWIGTDIEEPSTTVTIEKGSVGNRSYEAVWLTTVTLTVSGNNSTYRITVLEGENNLGTYSDSFTVVKGKDYTFNLETVLSANANTNDYEILRMSVGDSTKTPLASPMVTVLSNYELFSGTINAAMEIKLEYMTAYMMTVEVPTDTIAGVTLNVAASETNCVVAYSSTNSYIIADGTKVDFYVDTTPVGSGIEKAMFIGMKYTVNGTVHSADVNGGTKITPSGFVHNADYIYDSDIGRYYYSVSTDTEISKLEIVTVVSKSVVINTTYILNNTITLQSIHGINKILDKSTTQVMLYSGEWIVTKTALSYEQLELVFGKDSIRNENGTYIVTIS